jgi:hypothetical protein
MDGDDRVLGVELARKECPDLAGVDVGGECNQTGIDLGGDGLSLLRPIDKDGKVIGALAQRRGQRAILFEPPAALQDLLRGGLILPEVRIADAPLEARELVGQPRFVKVPSAARRRARPGYRIL